MPIGYVASTNKYHREVTQLMRRFDAHGVCIAVLGGGRGHGISYQFLSVVGRTRIGAVLMRTLADQLRAAADGLEAEAVRVDHKADEAGEPPLSAPPS